jgi:hypothetical protein
VVIGYCCLGLISTLSIYLRLDCLLVLSQNGLLLSSDVDIDDVQVFIPVSLYTSISLNFPGFVSLDIQVEDNK